jgi:DNA-directed RNA polymerase specialized sigma subunit
MAPVPRYFFHLRNDASVIDKQGQELTDEDAAHEVARKLAIELAAVSVAKNQNLNLHHRIEVADEDRSTLMVVEVGDVVSVQS